MDAKIASTNCNSVVLKDVFTNQFPRNVIGSLQQFCDSNGNVNTLGLLNFRSPSTMKSLGLCSQTKEDESDYTSSGVDDSDVEFEEVAQDI